MSEYSSVAFTAPVPQDMSILVSGFMLTTPFTQSQIRLPGTHSHLVRHLLPSRKLHKLALCLELTGFQLFGHEIVAVLCGLVWGLWIGFAIVVAGSFLGELGNF
jgi:hypothetical protein